MKLTNDEKLRASTAMLRGDHFRMGGALLFMIDGEYCVADMNAPVINDTRIFTKSWIEALRVFESYL